MPCIPWNSVVFLSIPCIPRHSLIFLVFLGLPWYSLVFLVFLSIPWYSLVFLVFLGIPGYSLVFLSFPLYSLIHFAGPPPWADCFRNRRKDTGSKPEGSRKQFCHRPPPVLPWHFPSFDLPLHFHLYSCKF